ncbi:hypothetical protein HG531_008312 [Fusarium graminearum]|nr:hypothetical protein HG531_008312 [Fusarium graminearum]
MMMRNITRATLDVLRHDAPHVVDFSLGVPNGVVTAAGRGAVVNHEILELRVERGGAVVGHVGEVGALGELLQEALADLEEVAKGHATAERRVGDDEEGETAGGWVVSVLGGRLGDVVDLVLAVGVGKLLGVRVFDFREDEGGER